VAARFLEDRGATIVERNARVGRGELDLIVSIKGQVTAVEVKAGTANSDPMFHFDEAKQSQVRSLAAQRGIHRIDYVGVVVSARGVAVTWLPCIC
jgi:Holliday junction resolvase-like predicted endonuclease